MSEVSLYTLRVNGDRGANSKALSLTREPGSASLGLADYYQVDMLRARHTFVSLQGGESLGSHN